MNQLQNNQLKLKKQRPHNGLPIMLDTSEPEPVKNIVENAAFTAYSKTLDKLFKEFFPTLFEKDGKAEIKKDMEAL